jgi:hypothetical protein
MPLIDFHMGKIMYFITTTLDMSGMPAGGQDKNMAWEST